MIHLLIALTLITGVNYDSRTEKAVLMAQAIDYLDPCKEHQLLNRDDIKMLLRARPKWRRTTWRNIRQNFDDYTREAIETAADYVDFWHVTESDEPIRIPTKEPVPSPEPHDPDEDAV